MVSLGYLKVDNIKLSKGFKAEIDEMIQFVLEENERFNYVTFMDSIRPESVSIIQTSLKNYIQSKLALIFRSR